MKPLSFILAVYSLTLSVNSLFAQGNLAPKGPPGPMMKTLDQIYDHIDEVNDPRIPLVKESPGVEIGPAHPGKQGTITITQSGSYYLTSNLSVSAGHGIIVNTSGVTIDLNGFTITSEAVTADGSGIFIQAGDVNVFNGHIVSGTTYDGAAIGDQFTGTGFVNGVLAPGVPPIVKNIRVQNLTVTGCDQYGIFCSDFDSTQVSSCHVRIAGSRGIRAGVVMACLVDQCGSVGIEASTVDNCRAASTASHGISAKSVSNCYAETFASNNDDGINASSVQNSVGIAHGTGGGSHGIQAGTVVSSQGSANGGDGINARIVNNCYGYASETGDDGIGSIGAVHNSYGISNSDNGIEAEMVTNCYGRALAALADHGISATLVAYSYGYSTATEPTDYGIEANRAIGCYAVGGQAITNKYLMP